MKNNKILIVGLGVSGVACALGLNKMGACIYIYDSSPENKLIESLRKLKDVNAVYYFNNDDFDVEDIDLVIKSPGIDYKTPLIQKLISNNKKIISDIEAAYLVTKGEIVSITGTNGKTTTTTLIGEIVKESGRKYRLTGNIGSGIFLDGVEAEENEILIAEVSSFQLAGIDEYKPHISVLTNITPDHLDWHDTLENYINAKFNNAINQDESDFAILNYEDEVIREYSNNIKSNIIFFSADRELEEGVFVQNGRIIYKKNNQTTGIIDIKDIFIPGKHNIENALASVGVAMVLGIDNKTIERVLREFKGVEHRLEFSGEYDGVKFYNDSKGTNPDASIKAVEGIEAPIILIAGGYDKKSEYDEFIKKFNNKVKALILMGQTAENIKKCALKYGFSNIYIVENMDEAVKKSYELSQPGDNVVLSPACASWGMYKNYEVRGIDFKERVRYYGRYAQR